MAPFSFSLEEALGNMQLIHLVPEPPSGVETCSPVCIAGLALEGGRVPSVPFRFREGHLDPPHMRCVRGHVHVYSPTQATMGLFRELPKPGCVEGRVEGPRCKTVTLRQGLVSQSPP